MDWLLGGLLAITRCRILEPIDGMPSAEYKMLYYQNTGASNAV